jgi:hypothetical protein
MGCGEGAMVGIYWLVPLLVPGIRYCKPLMYAYNSNRFVAKGYTFNERLSRSYLTMSSYCSIQFVDRVLPPETFYFNVLQWALLNLCNCGCFILREYFVHLFMKLGRMFIRDA